MLFIILYQVGVTVQTLKPEDLKEDCPITTFSEFKDFHFVFFGKRTNDILKLEGCFLGGQISSNGFEVENSCVVEP